MSEQYDNNLRGVLFRNKDKDPNDPAKKNWGDFTGSCEIDGSEFWLTAWVNESKAGEKYFAISFKYKEPKPVQAPSHAGPVPAQVQGTPEDNPFDDDIPF